MREVGAQLRQARLERGDDLNDVAQHLRIKSSYLFGIEQGDLSAMPGRPYALGFLRTYADYLGFDGEDLITRIKSTVENLTARTSLRIRTPMPENRLPKTPVVVISLAVVAGVYAGWSYLNHSSRTIVETVAEVPSDLRARTLEAISRESGQEPAVAASPTERAGSAGVPETASGAAAAVADPAAPGVASTTDAAPREAVAGAPSDPAAPPGAAQGPQAASDRSATPEAGRSVERGSLAERVAPAALAVQPAAGAASAVDSARDGRSPSNPSGGGPDAPRADQRVDGDARVILRARERAWIQVSSPAGDYVFRRTLEPGEAFGVPNRSDLELWTGNAGGLEIIVDGAPVPALAGGGAVRRHVSLDPDRLLAAAGQPR